MSIFRILAASICLIQLLLVPSSSSPLPPVSYNVIGPFPEGFREIGADPLSAFGGIFNISQKTMNGSFPSDLGTSGKVSWKVVDSQSNGLTVIDYPNWSESFLQDPYGWSILIWQGWAVGQFNVQSSGRYLLQCLNTKMVYVDEKELPGDWFGYGYFFNAVDLEAGQHTMIVRLESSVREFGNTPNISFQCRFLDFDSDLIVLPSLSTSGAVVPVLLPSIVDGYLTSSGVALPIMNAGASVMSNITVSTPQWGVAIHSPSVTLYPGQMTMLSFDVFLPEKVSCPYTLKICVNDESGNCVPFTLSFTCVSFGSAYVFTFRDYDHSVQWAAVVPPTTPCSSNSFGKCSVMVATHGAGVEGTSPFWSGAFNQEPNSWIFLPTGRRPWGYDWHGPSQWDIFRGLEHFSKELPGVASAQKANYQVDLARTLWTGHSMGGAGCWFLSTHYPDTALAAACVAGFISIEKYVPFYLRLSYSRIDPSLKGILQSAIAQYDSDLHIGNLQGVPVMARYGSLDNNVPPWNSRRLARILDEDEHNPSSVIVSEVAGENHWWDQAMNGPEIQGFYTQYAPNALPAFPQKFKLTVINPDSMGSKGSIKVLQTSIPFRKATVHVSQESTWKLKTANVRRFGLVQDSRGPNPASTITIDKTALSIKYLPDYHYCLLDSGNWKICDESSWKPEERRPGQYGPVFELFEKHFTIVYGSLGDNTDQLVNDAVNLANMWYLYSNGNVTILSDQEALVNPPEHSVVLLGNPAENAFSYSIQSQLPVTFAEDGKSFTIGDKVYEEDHLGIVFLGPYGKDQLALSVAGTSALGNQLAFKSIPIFTGVTVPDFYAVRESFLWEGDGGVVAAGYWNHDWTYHPVMSYML